MKYIIISESKVNKMAFLFLDSYLENHSPEDKGDLIVYGRGKNNVVAYDKNERLLMVADSLMNKVQDMFNLSNVATKKLFRDYFESKGLTVKRFH